jgi:hypothetical protein
MGIVLVVYYLILSQRKRSFSFEMQGIIYAIIISCALQALYGILQYWGVLQCTSSFRITGSFDNPAGFASSLCAGIPFLWFVWNGLKECQKQDVEAENCRSGCTRMDDRAAQHCGTNEPFA